MQLARHRAAGVIQSPPTTSLADDDAAITGLPIPLTLIQRDWQLRSHSSYGHTAASVTQPLRAHSSYGHTEGMTSHREI